VIILGIDPGYGTIGYGVIEKLNGKIRAIDYGVITTPKEKPIAERLEMIYDAMNHIIDKFKPDEIALEELFFNTNITTGIKVAQARGVLVLSAIKSCGKLFEYTPLQVKMALTGEGRAEKRQVQYMVKMLLKLSTVPRPDDAADALAVAVCHAHTVTFNKRTLV
jgi:crossover junction endodeoxyribonuclease RuvC